MKKTLLILSFLFCAVLAFAQAPTQFKYQGVARDINQQPFTNTALGLKITVVLDNGSGSGAGIVQYAETHLAFTSPVGVFSVMIGDGEPVFGELEEINWGSGAYWLKVEMDVNGGDDYVYMGNSPILPVPLAVHAMTVEDKDDADANPTNELQSISFDPNTNQLSISGGNSISIPAGQADADADPNNEIQSLAFDLETNTLSLSNGGQVDLSSLQGGAGSDDQTLELNGTTLSIEGGNQVNLVSLQDGTEDADANPANELQTISFDPITNQLSISQGNSISIPSGGADADADPQNELQNLSLNGTTLAIDGGNEVNLAVLQDGNEDADANPANELQTISFDPNTNQLSISQGNTISIPSGQADADADPQNELQNLSLNGTTLAIDGGNQVNLAVLQDGTEDADADPANELQSIQFNANSNILSLTNGGQVDLSVLQGGGSDDQTLQLNGTTLSIEGGNEVNLALLQDGTEDADADPSNELQDLQLVGTTLSIDGGNQVNLAVLQDGTEDADADPANELQSIQFNANSNILSLTNGGQVDLSVLQGGGSDDQTLQLNGTTLSIEGGNEVNLALLQDGTEDADADPANELQDLQLVGTTLSIDGGNQVNLAVLQDGTQDADANPTNELQTIQFDANSGDLMISNGNTINLPFNPDDNDASPFNELQTLSLNGTLLNLSDGGQVNLSGLGGSSLWSENGNSNIYTLEDVAIGFTDTQLSSLEVKEDFTVRRANGNATIDIFSATPGGNINIYRGNGTGGSNDLLLNLNGSNDGGQIFLRDPDSGIRGEFLVQSSGGGLLNLMDPSGTETISLTTSGNSSGMFISQPDGDDAFVFGASGFGGIAAVYGSGGDIAADIGRDASNTNRGKMRVYDTAGNPAVAIGGNLGGEVELMDGNILNVYLGTINASSVSGKVAVYSSGSQEVAGMYSTNAGQGILFADVKNFRMDHPEDTEKEIWYACVEGPEAAAYERGTAQLVNGEATITFPDHFGLVANHETMTVMLTPLSADCKGLAVIEKTATGFTVKELFQGSGTYDFDWEVKCVRKGYENYQPVRAKKDGI